MKIKAVFFAAVFTWGFAACAAPTPAPNIIPANSPTPLPLFNTSPESSATSKATSTPLLPETPTPEPAFTPTPTVIPLSTLKPFVTATSLRFDSWSPDSQWIAYWQSEGDSESPASLVFANVLTEEICQHEEVATENTGYGYLLWQEEGTVVAILNLEEDAMGGQPCETFTVLNDFSLPEWGVDISPDGRYRAQYTILSWEEQTMHSETTITDLSTGETIVSLQWDTGINFAHRAGPSWLNNEIFLMGKGYDQGWIYASMPEGRIGNVFSDLFGLEVQLEDQVEILISQSDASTGKYHLMTVGGLMPSILLYHSELDWVEELPFKGISFFTMHGSSMGISPDSKWMLLSDPIGEEHPPGQVGQDVWLRRIDPPGGETIPIPKHLGGHILSPDVKKMALFNPRSILIISFPDAQSLSRWGTSSYDLSPVNWSPDGKWLAAYGFPQDTGETALFIFMP